MDELKKGWVTAAEVHAHLESVLKCPIKSDFKVITGANPFDVYVRMRIAIEDKYALDTTGANSYVDQVLAANCSELPLRDSIYKKLLKFMYPQDVNDLRQFILNQNPQKLLNKGIYGANLKELLDNATPHHSAKYSEIAVSLSRYYSMISVTTPDPTVLPPSLIANLSPSSIAIGVISLMLITTLSPGMHISVPSGRVRSPVTSVVLK